MSVVAKKDSFVLLRIDGTQGMLTGANWFFTLDLKSGYWQVALHFSNREKAVFYLSQGLCWFTVMPIVSVHYYDNILNA